MFLLVSVRHVVAHPGGHQHGVSIQISINLGKTFLRISRIRNIPLAWILANLEYLPPFISQIPDLIYWTVLILILIYFEWRDNENQQLFFWSCNVVVVPKDARCSDALVILLTCKKLMIARAVKFSWINTFQAQIIIVFLLKLKSGRLLSWSLIKEPRKDFCQENANKFEIRHSFWRFEPKKKSSRGNKGTTELLSYLLIINKLTMNLIDRV